MTTKPFWMESTWKHEFYNQRLSSSPRRTRFPVRCKLVESNLLVCRVMPQNGRWFLSFQVSTVLFLKVSLICCHFNIISTFFCPNTSYGPNLWENGLLFDIWKAWWVSRNFWPLKPLASVRMIWQTWLMAFAPSRRKKGRLPWSPKNATDYFPGWIWGTGRIGRFLFSWKKSMSLGTSNRRNVWSFNSEI